VTNDARTDKVGPVDHILRAALPWRVNAHLTECGKPADELAGRLVTRDEAAARINRIGQKRAAFTLCMTCAETSDRHHRFAPVDAVAVLARETGGLQHAREPLGPSSYGESDRWSARYRRAGEMWAERQRVNAECEALAALVDAHREEFEAFLAGKAETASLDAQRTKRRQRRGPVGR
jgi:hypothetical protein